MFLDDHIKTINIHYKMETWKGFFYLIVSNTKNLISCLCLPHINFHGPQQFIKNGFLCLIQTFHLV
jgi:hypothetical protein